MQDSLEYLSRICQKLKKIGNLLEKDRKFMFDETCLQTFEELKLNLTSAHIVATPDWSIPFELICDASEYVIGIVLAST